MDEWRYIVALFLMFPLIWAVMLTWKLHKLLDITESIISPRDDLDTLMNIFEKYSISHISQSVIVKELLQNLMFAKYMSELQIDGSEYNGK